MKRLKPDQLAALCPCSQVVVVTMFDTGHIGGIGASVEYSGTCAWCGRVHRLAVQAQRSRITVPIGAKAPP